MDQETRKCAEMRRTLEREIHMLGMDCANVMYHNDALISTAARLVQEIRKMPAQNLSGELRYATASMEEAVKYKSCAKVIGRTRRLVADVEHHPLQYISESAVATAAELKKLVQRYF